MKTLAGVIVMALSVSGCNSVLRPTVGLGPNGPTASVGVSGPAGTRVTVGHTGRVSGSVSPIRGTTVSTNGDRVVGTVTPVSGTSVRVDQSGELQGSVTPPPIRVGG
ncbi:hypothetical protein [Palleronia caenipelagi]|uniref:Uncharacterized protein n=1 Tax=Palleronia caenipelagi TaxID=2489174 RepID=A0A547QA53_9RHOB|nr:hypothetical protein [Palleronia caenipelagi]TRD23278.1 hypothetical protein FEV53_01595 [Palleronia caenipelagi]